jgi:hypothetical protein
MRIMSAVLFCVLAAAPVAARADLWVNIDSPLVVAPGTKAPCPLARVSSTYRNGKTTALVFDCTSTQGTFSVEANIYKYTDASKYRTCYFSYRWTGRWDLSVHSNKGCTIHWVNGNTLDVL